MTFARVALLTALASTAALSEVTPRKASSVTVIFKSDVPIAEATYVALHQELDDLLAPLRIGTNLRALSDIEPREQFDDIVLVTVTGTCALDLRVSSRPVFGAMAVAHSSDGQVLPFVDVRCERIRDTIRPAVREAQYRNIEALFGRAMARVLAHELYHVLGRTKRHGSSGLTAESLSGEQLLRDGLRFHTTDLQQIATGLSRGFH